MKTAESIEAYIATFPLETQKLLEQVRQTIREEVPEATEAIKYAIPTFILGGNLVHFAGYKNHIGFYPTPNGVAAFAEELSKYKQGKGSVQFPIDGPMPLDLVRRIVRYRVAETQKKAKPKK